MVIANYGEFVDSMKSIHDRKSIHIDDQILCTIVKMKSNVSRMTRNEYKELNCCRLYPSKYLFRAADHYKVNSKNL